MGLWPVSGSLPGIGYVFAVIHSVSFAGRFLLFGFLSNYQFCWTSLVSPGISLWKFLLGICLVLLCWVCAWLISSFTLLDSLWLYSGGSWFSSYRVKFSASGCLLIPGSSSPCYYVLWIFFLVMECMYCVCIVCIFSAD